jgi:hypothetical protein
MVPAHCVPQRDRHERTQQFLNTPLPTRRDGSAGVIPAANQLAPEEGLEVARTTDGKRRAVFDVVEIESGYGVFRASVWAGSASTCWVTGFRRVARDRPPRSRGSPRAAAVVLGPRWGGTFERVTHPVTQGHFAESCADGCERWVTGSATSRHCPSNSGAARPSSLATSPCSPDRRHPRKGTHQRRRGSQTAIRRWFRRDPSTFWRSGRGMAQEHGCNYIRAS